jgi:hypothetical protein
MADVFAEPDGTIVLRFHPRCMLDEAGAAEVVRAHVSMADGVRRPVLVDARGLIAADRAARQLAVGADVNAITSRMAILVGTPVTRVLGNFFLRVTAPRYPTQIFSDEARARAWLSGSAA